MTGSARSARVSLPKKTLAPGSAPGGMGFDNRSAES